MPTLSRYFIKAGFVCLAGAMLAAIAGAAGIWEGAFYFAYLHLLVLGWITQIIFGVALWLFPRQSKERPFGDVRPAWASFVLLNLGLLVRILFEPQSGRGGIVAWSLVTAAVLQWLAVVLFAVYIWRRVRSK